MKQAVLLIDCYLYGTIAILAVVLLVLVYLHGQANHLPNPFARKNIVYRPAPKARGVLLGKKYGLLAYSPEPDEGHIIVMGPSGTGKTSALLIPTLRSWQGTALVVDISGDISANVGMPNKIIFDPTAKDCVPYDVFASIDAAPDESERQERLEQLAYLLLPDKANDSEAGIFFAKNGRKMITAALICYYGMGWGFVEICEYFLGHDWRSLLNDIAQQKNKIANMYISSFVGASEQNTAGCKQAADDALKLFATNDKIKNALRKTASYEPSISPATLETNSIYGSIDGKWGAHTRPDHSSAGTALGDKSDLACGENAAMESCIFDEEHLYYLWYNSKGHRDAMLNPNANGMACAVREYNGLVFGIQIFVNDPNYTASTQSAASDTSTPVEIAAVVVADSATTETAAN